MLRLVEKDDLGPAVGDPVLRPGDHLAVREADPLVASTDPRVAVGRLAEQVELPETRRGLAEPRLVGARECIACLLERRDEPLRRRADDEELEPGQGLDELVQAVRRNRDLEVLVLAPLATEEEIDRPARRDVPRRLHTGQTPRRLLRAPGVPLRHVGLEATGVASRVRYSHSMVPGGFDVRSSATRVTAGTSLMSRPELVSRT